MCITAVLRWRSIRYLRGSIPRGHADPGSQDLAVRPCTMPCATGQKVSWPADTS